jgi:hypothetical protein
MNTDKNDAAAVGNVVVVKRIQFIIFFLNFNCEFSLMTHFYGQFLNKDAKFLFKQIKIEANYNDFFSILK